MVVSPAQKVRANLEGGTTVQSTWLWGGTSTVTQRYGCTRVPGEDPAPAGVCTNDPHGSLWHHGLDIADNANQPNPNAGCTAPYDRLPSGPGSPLYADGPGTIIAAGSTSYGTILEWRRDSDGYYVVLYHTQAISVHPNDRLSAGQQIAQVGNNGWPTYSSACHLHFEIRKPPGGYWDDIDPTPFLGGCRAVIAFQGAGQQMYSCRYGQAGFLVLGGSLQGSPAVAGANGVPLYVATGFNDGVLYVRSDSQNWQGLVPSKCWDNPAIAASGTTLYVGCTGSIDSQLYVGETPIPASGLPTFQGMNAAGGHLWAGPAVALMYGVPRYFVIGDTNPNGDVYYTSGNGQWAQLLGWGCNGHVGVSSQWDKAILACHGTDDNVWYAISGDGGASWSNVVRMTVFGNVLNGVGVAMTRNGDALVVVEGRDYALYQSWIPWTQAPQTAQNVPSNFGGGTAATQL